MHTRVYIQWTRFVCIAAGAAAATTAGAVIGE